jgi:hypothetical protein
MRPGTLLIGGARRSQEGGDPPILPDPRSKEWAQLPVAVEWLRTIPRCKEECDGMPQVWNPECRD